MPIESPGHLGDVWRSWNPALHLHLNTSQIRQTYSRALLCLPNNKQYKCMRTCHRRLCNRSDRTHLSVCCRSRVKRNDSGIGLLWKVAHLKLSEYQWTSTCTHTHMHKGAGNPSILVFKGTAALELTHAKNTHIYTHKNNFCTFVRHEIVPLDMQPFFCKTFSFFGAKMYFRLFNYWISFSQTVLRKIKIKNP